MTARDEPAGSSVGRRLAGKTAALAASQLLSRVVGLAFTLTLARLLSVETFGLLNLALTAVVLTGIVQDFGISRTVVKEIARQPRDAAFWVGGLAPLRLIVAAAAAAALPALLAGLGFRAPEIRTAALAALVLPSASLWLLIENAGQGIGAVRLIATGTIMVGVFQAGFGLAAAVAFGQSLTAILLFMVCANGVATALMWRNLTALVGPIAWRVDTAFWRRVLRDSVPYLGAAIGLAAIGRVEALVLGWSAGAAEVARFVVAFKVFETGLFVLYAAQIAMNPLVAKLIVTSPSDLERWFSWATGLVACLIVPAVVGGTVCAAAVIGLLFPSSYAEAAAPLAVLVATLPFAGLQVLSSGVLTLTDRRGGVLGYNACVIVVQLAANLLLDASHGAFGAALALAASQVFAAGLGVALVARWVIPDRRLPRPLLAALAVSAVSLGAGLIAGETLGMPAGYLIALGTAAAGVSVARLRLTPPL